jgi:hypothetical protein
MNYSISKIEEMVENKKFSTKIIPVIQTLFSSVNDWPETLDNFYDYDIAVQNFIKNTTTRNHIELALKKVDVCNYAWEAESLSYLVEIYDYFEEGITLKEIIDKVISETLACG